jgi:hypothetical protein
VQVLILCFWDKFWKYLYGRFIDFFGSDFECQKRADTVAQFNLDEINSTKSLEFADLFLVFIDDFELGNSIRSFVTHQESCCAPSRPFIC